MLSCPTVIGQQYRNVHRQGFICHIFSGGRVRVLGFDIRTAYEITSTSWKVARSAGLCTGLVDRGSVKIDPSNLFMNISSGVRPFRRRQGIEPFDTPPRKIQPCVYNFLIKELNQVLMQMSVGILSLSSSSSLLWLSLFWAQQIQYNCVCVCVCFSMRPELQTMHERRTGEMWQRPLRRPLRVFGNKSDVSGWAV